LLAIGLAIGLATTAVSAADPLQLDAGRLGRLDIVVPDGAAQGLVFLLSGDDGITLEIEDAAADLAERGSAVAPVDTPAWLRRMRDVLGHCIYLVSDLEDTSRQIQARLGTRHYLSPVVVGTGSGAAVAYAALAQAPAATLDGAASDGFTTFIATARPLCPGAEATAVPGGFTYAPTADLPGWWRVAPSADQLVAARAFRRAGGLDSDEDSLFEVKPGMTLAERVGQLVETRIRATIEAESPLNDLPLIELPADGPDRRMAVIWSGDGGWRDLDKQIGERLAAEGVPVIGVDTLRYFWSAKPPEAMAKDLAAIIEHYALAWNRPEVLLIGYSFGADVLPFAYNRLSQPAQARVKQLSLLGLSTFADFEIHVSAWVSESRHPNSLDTAPELARLDGVAVQCFYGAEETDTGCTLPELKGAQIVRTTGGHHFDGDYAALARRILAGRD
jgi:type IV secretory pathway VirJ component